MKWLTIAGGAALVLSASLWRGWEPAPSEVSVAYGREVFINEGCIHCHSQYERPREQGMLRSVEQVTEQVSGEPVLIGNRRQGPDLSQAGVWHSEQWHREHLKNPSLIRPGSRMPSYGYLFEDGDVRGPSLVAFLSSLGRDREGDLKGQLASDVMSASVLASGDAQRGMPLYQNLCASCHGAKGQGDGPAADLFDPRPADFTGHLKYALTGDGRMDASTAAFFVRQGVAGSAMPGHPWLSENEVADLVACLMEFRKKGGGE